jgi:hypothetical protein
MLLTSLALRAVDLSALRLVFIETQTAGCIALEQPPTSDASLCAADALTINTPAKHQSVRPAPSRGPSKKGQQQR